MFEFSTVINFCMLRTKEKKTNEGEEMLHKITECHVFQS